MANRPTEIITVKETVTDAACDGGLGALGHPTVYLPFDGSAVVDCYYCSRRFVKESLVQRAASEKLDLHGPIAGLR